MLEWSFDTQDELAARATRRDFAHHVARVYGPSADAMAAELVLGELISNVVRYAPGRTLVQAHFDPEGVTVAVQDFGKGFSPKRADRENMLLDESGRGLAIVSKLAQEMEIKCRGANGCRVRARLEMRRAS